MTPRQTTQSHLPRKTDKGLRQSRSAAVSCCLFSGFEVSLTKPLLRGNVVALLSEVLGSAGMIGDGGDAGREVQVQLGTLGMDGGDGVDVLEHTGDEVVHIVLGHIITGDDHGAHSHSGGVGIQAVSIGGDDVLAVIGGLSQQGVDMLIIQAHQVSGLGAGQLGDGGGGSAGHHKGGVDLAVLQCLSAVAEALIGGVDVLLNVQAISAQNVHGIVEHAGAGVAHGDVLALQVGHGLDAGIAGDDLDLLHVQGSDGGEVSDGSAIEVTDALVGISHNVGLHEAQLGVANLHVLNVSLRTAGRNNGHLGAGSLANLTGQNAAKAEVGTLITASGEGQAGAALFAAGHGLSASIGAGAGTRAGTESGAKTGTGSGSRTAASIKKGRDRDGLHG